MLMFDNPFHVEDLMVFDDETMRRIISCNSFGLSIETLARALQGAPDVLIGRIIHTMPSSQRSHFLQELHQPVPQNQIEAARRDMLDSLFWELTYWKTPELYNELTEGEQLHPGIFKQLVPDIRDKSVLDAGRVVGGPHSNVCVMGPDWSMPWSLHLACCASCKRNCRTLQRDSVLYRCMGASTSYRWIMIALTRPSLVQHLLLKRQKAVRQVYLRCGV